MVWLCPWLKDTAIARWSSPFRSLSVVSKSRFSDLGSSCYKSEEETQAKSSLEGRVIRRSWLGVQSRVVTQLERLPAKSGGRGAACQLA